MANLLLQVNKEVYQREERDEYGTVREAIASFAETNSLKGAKCVPVNSKNVATIGKQLLLVVKEVNKAKKPSNLLVSDTIHVGREISDMVREGEIAFSALLDFPIIHHSNESNGAEYLLVVRPTATSENDEEALAGFELTVDTAVTKTYEREVPAIEDILKSMAL